MTPTGPMAGICTNWSCQWEVKQLTCSCKFRVWWCPVGPAAWASSQTQGSGTYRGGNYFCMEVVQSFFVAKLMLESLPWSSLRCLSVHSWYCCVQGQKVTHLPITIDHKGDSWDPSFGKEQHWLVGHKLDESSGHGGPMLPADIKIICRKEEPHHWRGEALET